eukprot:Skav232891  [mRNA]  locus=scaffold4134:40590:40883:+ [translate_table: standard]
MAPVWAGDWSEAMETMEAPTLGDPATVEITPEVPSWPSWPQSLDQLNASRRLKLYAMPVMTGPSQSTTGVSKSTDTTSTTGLPSWTRRSVGCQRQIG